jgi:hypothetical protein
MADTERAVASAGSTDDALSPSELSSSIQQQSTSPSKSTVVNEAAGNNDVTRHEADDSDDESISNGLNIHERRAAKVQRNYETLESLGLLRNKDRYFYRRPGLDGAEKSKNGSKPVEDGTSAIRPTQKSFLLPVMQPSNIIDVEAKYPHRKEQIRLLSGLLNLAARAGRDHSPAPIFVSGLAGVGKTSIVRDIVDSQRAQGNTVDAYIDATALDRISAPSVIGSIARQFGMNCPVNDAYVDQNSSQDMLDILASDTPLHAQDNRPPKRQRPSEDYNVGTDVNNGNGESKLLSTTKSNKPPPAKLANDVSTMVISLGRYLQLLFGTRYNGILIIDNAEQLEVVWQKRSASDKPNVLAQLLLLPKALRLNLTVVAVSKSVLLDHSCKYVYDMLGFDMLVGASVTCILPVLCQPCTRDPSHMHLQTLTRTIYRIASPVAYQSATSRYRFTFQHTKANMRSYR